jgi:hypothetical protein
MPSTANGRLVTLTLITALISQGCSTAKLHSYTPPPAQLENQVQIPGFPDVRAWGDTRSSSLEKSALNSIQQEKTANHGKLQEDVAGLALSGGGQDGAFGVGVLCGWSASGTRPTFKMVTGISTGALIAPFAFLGPAYDAQLKYLYTTISTKNIYKTHNPVIIFLSLWNIKPLDSLAANSGLIKLIEQYVDEDMLKKIAAEHQKGRRLLVGTTQLNAQRLVIWDMGAIALKGTPEALRLFRKVLLASTSIPVGFPPQFFKVEAAGQGFEEMHVDGGVETEVVLFENAIRPFSSAEQWSHHHRQRKIYVIRNQKVTPEWQYVSPQVKYIAARSIESLTKSQGIGDLYRLYVYAKRDNIDYNLAFIPIDFTMKPKSFYDKNYMNALFEKGYEMGKKGFPWNKFPPDYDSGN